MSMYTCTPCTPTEQYNITKQYFFPVSPTNPPIPPTMNPTQTYQREKQQHTQAPYWKPQKKMGAEDVAPTRAHADKGAVTGNKNSTNFTPNK